MLTPQRRGMLRTLKILGCPWKSKKRADPGATQQEVAPVNNNQCNNVITKEISITTNDGNITIMNNKDNGQGRKH